LGKALGHSEHPYHVQLGFPPSSFTRSLLCWMLEGRVLSDRRGD
jgi:hypothetical protein